MKKTLLRIGSACGLAMLYFTSPNAYAFCTEFEVADVGVNCVGQGHKRVTTYIKPILYNEIWQTIWIGNFAQDNPSGNFAGDGQRHFESCRFRDDLRDVDNIPTLAPGSIDYINETYRSAVSYLNPADPKPFTAADRFGKLLHTVQDFYSHTNWINLLGITEPTPAHPADLFDRGLGEWPETNFLEPIFPQDPVRGDIILGQIPYEGLPLGWSTDQEVTSETPEFMTNEGEKLRGLIVGWNPGSPCPKTPSRAGETTDEYSHFEIVPNENPDPETGDTGETKIEFPRTLKLTHGESKIAGKYDLISLGPLNYLIYDELRPCHDGYPTYVCLQKDHPGRPDYEQVIRLAAWQTAQEWCRLLHLAKDSPYGYAASSILMTLWAVPHDEYAGSDPITLGACGTPPEVIAGKPGPIELKVDGSALVDFLPGPDGGPGSRNVVFALYTGDFRRSNYRTARTLTDETNVNFEPITMCVKPSDKLVATVQGWDDFNNDVNDPHFDKADRILRGRTAVLSGPDFQPEDAEEDNQDMSVSFDVDIGGDDPDGDGLTSACGEPFYDTNPLVADTDGDGLNDGAEVNTYHTDPLVLDTDGDALNDGAEVNTYHTDPLVPDTDDDGLTDGAEVNTYHTNPLNPDTDNDGLTDGDEVNTYGTNPNKADTDEDGLPDGIEVKYGTNPLLSDTDGDGLPDGKDVDWIEDVIAAIPNAAIKSPAAGNRNAMLNLLNDAEALLLKGSKGNRKAALDKLNTLRSRNDGCGAAPDGNDWIVDCAIQTEVRMLVDLLIANVSA